MEKINWWLTKNLQTIVFSFLIVIMMAAADIMINKLQLKNY